MPSRCCAAALICALVTLGCPMPTAAGPERPAAPAFDDGAKPEEPSRSQQPACTAAGIRLSDDYEWAIGNVALVGDPRDGAGTYGEYRWLVNGLERDGGRLTERLALSFDDTADGANGETPTRADGVGYTAGRWSGALALQPGGVLSYPRDGLVDLEQGTVEMWVAMRADGDAAVYSDRGHVLFMYRSANGDSVAIAQSQTSGILYAGGSVGGAWQSAYGARADTRAWLAGEWHHIAYTYSASGNFMRFYVDGVLAADSNEHTYVPPLATATSWTVGGDPAGQEAAYWIDAFTLSGRPLTDAEIAAHAGRWAAPQPNEQWAATSALSPGDRVVFEVTPHGTDTEGTPCATAPLEYHGRPVFDPEPMSTLLSAGTTTLRFTAKTSEPTACAYGIGEPVPYGHMTPFDEGAGTRDHTTEVRGIDPDPNVVTELYVRCANYPDYALHERYRVLSRVAPGYPRTGNLWGSWGFVAKGMAYASRIDLWLGAAFTPDQIRQLRRLNPDIRMLTSINAIEQRGLPDGYYLKDVNGNRIEVWPGSFRLNITKPYVAEHQARLAYEAILDADLMFDGCFFDNVMTTQSWQTHDIYGHPFLVDADEDGQVDDPAAFDAAWKAGVFRELGAFRQLMPHAITTGHSMNIWEPGIAGIFNGISIGFQTADVIEGKRSFADLLATYEAWQTEPRAPEATMIESSPPDQLAYGYDYSPWNNAPPSTIEFGRTFYPYMRFGLAFTLLGDGYFAHEWGDTWHGNDWWYDELDYDLGRPIGPARRIGSDPDEAANLVDNSGFEEPLAGSWRLWVNRDAGCDAAARQDAAEPAAGAVSARIDITATSGSDWHVDFAQFGRSLDEGMPYDVVFWARADRSRAITLATQKGSPDWRSYGLSRHLVITGEWREYRVPFSATETVTDSRLQFLVGAVTGTVWLDDVRLLARGPDVFRRDFEHGSVLLNASRERQVVAVGAGLARLSGHQAPRTDVILDDSDAGFTAVGDWRPVTYDSGEWSASGPFYHDWAAGCHELVGAGGVAEWSLPVSATGLYTVSAWWPAAPVASTWTSRAQYDIAAGDRTVASQLLDQRVGGDEWHEIGTARLDATEAARVRLRCDGAAPCVADALHVQSLARYNDGSPAASVDLAPMDGIVLRRLWSPVIYLPLVTAGPAGRTG